MCSLETLIDEPTPNRVGLRRGQVFAFRTNAELPFHRGRVQVRGRDIGVVAIRAVGQGQRSAVTAFGDLRQHYSPGVIALVGIGGGIHTDTAIGDVVVGTRVVYYDLRKETAGHVQRRGDEDSAPVPIVRAVNSFFDDYGEPARFRTAGRNGVGREYRVLDGLIGTGEAVIADAGSDIRTYLRRYNDNTRAVDMEAGGLVQAFYEQSGAERVNGWVVIRGISDSADRDKNDDAQEMAAWHAATLLRDLLPYLPVADSAGAEVT